MSRSPSGTTRAESSLSARRVKFAFAERMLPKGIGPTKRQTRRVSGKDGGSGLLAFQQVPSQLAITELSPSIRFVGPVTKGSNKRPSLTTSSSPVDSRN